MIELPYVLVRVVLFLAVVVPVLAVSVFWLLFRLILSLPQAILATVASKTSLTPGSHVKGSVGVSQPDIERDRQLAQMADGDPVAFIAAALDRVAVLWLLLQRSVVLGDDDMVRPSMTEGFWRVHKMVLELRARGRVERVFDGHIVDSVVVGAVHSGVVDELRVSIDCEGLCYDQSANPRLVLRGTVGPGRWREELTVRRSAGGAAPGSGALATQCPNCGAALDVNPDGSCRTCRALVASAVGDWVLDDAWREQW